MVKYYINSPHGERGLSEVDKPQKNCWIYMELPTVQEVASVVELTDIPENFIKAALDEEEVAHLDTENNARMVIVDIPKMSRRSGEDSQIYTVPLALIHNESYFVTVCTKATTSLNDFFDGKVKNVNLLQKHKLSYQIMYNCTTRFLYYLRQIDKVSDQIQKNLSKSMQNKELLQLLSLQKALVFFSASLTANYAIIQKISNSMCKLTESEFGREERDLLEDVIIENKQALEMCSVYREIIKSSMDAFASVVNNNQNLVMKFLTAITIILSIPMMISGFWGMNTGVPFEGQQWGFWITVGISGIISAVVLYFLSRKEMM